MKARGFRGFFSMGFLDPEVVSVGPPSFFMEFEVQLSPLT